MSKNGPFGNQKQAAFRNEKPLPSADSLDALTEEDEIEALNLAAKSENITLSNTYFASKAKEIAAMVRQEIADRQQDEQGLSGAMEAGGSAVIPGKEAVTNSEEPPQKEFIDVLANFLLYIDNLAALAEKTKPLDPVPKAKLAGMLQQMRRVIDDALTRKKWIFRTSKAIDVFFNEYFVILSDLKEHLTEMARAGCLACCSSKDPKKLALQKIQLLEYKIFAFPVLFNLEPRCFTKVVHREGETRLMRSESINLNEGLLAQKVQKILKTGFPELKPMRELRVRLETRTIEAPKPEIRVQEVYRPSRTPKLLIAHEHFFGMGRPQDLQTALRLYQEAEAEGEVEGATCLGKMYLKGQGVRRSFSKAFKCFERASKAGSVEATYQLGRMVEAGQVDSVDEADRFKLALEAFEHAAAQNHSDALADLAFMYEKGIGGSPDLTKAEDLYIKACNLENPRAMSNFASLVLAMNGESKPNVRKALELLERSAATAHPLGLANLGLCHLKGLTGKADYIAARQLINEASELGEPTGMFYAAYLAISEAQQSGSSEGYFEAAELLRRVIAADPQHVEALYYLGFLFEGGLGTDKDQTTAFYYFARAVEASGSTDGRAMYKMAKMLYDGRALGYSNKERALALFVKAAELGDPDAAYFLGVLHEEGYDVVRDPRRAELFYQVGSRQGHTDAQASLGLLRLTQKAPEGEAKLNGIEREDTRDDLESLSPEQLIIDAARKGNDRARKFLGSRRAKENALFFGFNKQAEGALGVPSQKTFGTLEPALVDAIYKQSGENHFGRVLQVNGLLNNYIKV